MCLHSGALCYYSGPHLGVISDVKLFKKYNPPLLEGELLLADKAYVDRSLQHQIVAPIKKKRNQPPLRAAQLEYNRLHGWNRASIEHAFGKNKRFRIIGNHST